MSKTLIVAHRGSSYEAPENTLPAIELAWSQGVDAVEVDVHLTRDNRVVVIHDLTTQRTAGVNKRVKDTTFDELRELDVGSWKGSEWRGIKIPSLEEILNSVPDSRKIFIEIKGGLPCLEGVKDIICQSRLKPFQIKLMDFDEKVVRKARIDLPNNEIFWLIEFRLCWLPTIRKRKIENVIKTALELNVDGINFEDIPELDAETIKKLRRNNLSCFCWTVNTKKRARYLIENGISGITTDRPDYLIGELKKGNKKV